MLNDIYKEDFEKIKKEIEKYAKKSPERTEAIENLAAIYEEAQKNSLPLEEIRGDSAEEYAKEIAGSLPEKKKLFQKKTVFAAICCAAFIALSIFVCIMMTDSYQIEKHGFNFIVNNVDKYAVNISENTHQVIISVNEKFEQETESGFSSHITPFEKGYMAEGFMENKGISVDDIYIGYEWENVLVYLRSEMIEKNDGTKCLYSPTKPENLQNLSGKYWYPNYYESEKVVINIGENRFTGEIRGSYIAKNGDIRFTVKTHLERGSMEGIEKEIAENGFELIFGSAYTIEWEKREGTSSFAFKNLAPAERIMPEYKIIPLQKATSDGFVKVLIGAFFDSDGKIVDLDNWTQGSYDGPVEDCHTDYADKARISEDGESVSLDVRYKITGEPEEIKETLVFTRKDVYYNFDD